MFCSNYRQDINSTLHLTPAAIGQCLWRSISPRDVGRAILLVELLMLRSGVLTFSYSVFSLEDVSIIFEYVACY